MKRRTFLSLMAGGSIMSLTGLNKILSQNKSTSKLPVVFIGHGSPMNALADNKFTQSLNNLGQDLATPQAILCISAHWMTKKTTITKMENPKTIHDFYGFPQELFDIQYPAPGNLELADSIISSISTPKIIADEHEWGLDHGTWSVLKHMYPLANIPVLQMSLDMTQAPEYHLELGKQLNQLRSKGVLIVGSGNIVHNLRALNWDLNAPAHDWATEFDQWTLKHIMDKNFRPLSNEFLNSSAGKLSNPSLDHYLPLLYTLGASEPSDEMITIYEGIEHSSLSMRTFILG